MTATASSIRAYEIRPGDWIAGTYHGVFYAGRVRSTRRHSMRHDVTVLYVDLTWAITVRGRTRDSLAVYIADDGTAPGGFAGATVNQAWEGDPQ